MCVCVHVHMFKCVLIYMSVYYQSFCFFLHIVCQSPIKREEE